MIVEKLQKIIEFLLEEDNVSPTQIASEIRSDRRTVNKILNTLSDIGIVEIKTIKLGLRKYASCKLTEDYKEIFKKRRNKR